MYFTGENIPIYGSPFLLFISSLKYTYALYAFHCVKFPKSKKVYAKLLHKELLSESPITNEHNLK